MLSLTLVYRDPKYGPIFCIVYMRVIEQVTQIKGLDPKP